MHSGKVSIIVPAYNQGHYLREAIQSGLDQTYEDLELIIVNDGSRDNTEEVVKGFNDHRIRYIYQENQGLSRARNMGIRHADGAFVSFLDADDRFLPEKLEQEIDVFEENPEVGFVAGQAFLVDGDGIGLGLMSSATIPGDPSLLLLGNPIAVGSVLLRRKWLDVAGIFDESLRACEDWDLWLRLARAGCSMKGLPSPVIEYRVHSDQMTRDVQRMRTAMLAVLDKMFKQPDLPATWRARQNEAYAAAYVRSAARAFHANQFDIAKKDLSLAVQLDQGLIEGKGEKLVEVLAGWADAPHVKDPLDYLEKVFLNLPEELAPLHNNHRTHLSNSALNIAYRQRNLKNHTKTRYYIFRAARYQPRILASRGILSILLRSFIQ